MILSEEDTMASPTLRRTHAVTLITGGAMGIGLAFAKAYAQRGKRLLLVDVRDDLLPDVASELSELGAANVQTLRRDLADESAPRAIVDHCNEQGLFVDTLINNAALGTYGPFLEQSTWRMEEIIRVNITSLVSLTRLLLPAMVERRAGTIINMTSTSAFESSPYWGVYAGTKAFVQSFTETLQHEFTGSGVYIASVCAGVTRTAFFAQAGLESPTHGQSPEDVVAEALAGFARRQPLIITGRNNRIRIQAQRANLRRLMANIKGGLRRVGVLS